METIEMDTNTNAILHSAAWNFSVPTYVGTLYKYLYYKYYLLMYLNVPTYLLLINTWLFRFGCLANDVTIMVISQMPRRHKKERKY